MSQLDTKNGNSKVAKAERKATADAKKRTEAEEWRDKTAKQRASIYVAMDALGIHTQELNHLASRHSALSGHLRAFYEEIEKLAKWTH